MSELEAHRRELIAFRIGAQEFCVDIMSVREIRGWAPATALPQSPEYVRGVINLRGAVLPVVDLSGRLGLGLADPTARHVIIVANIGSRLVGLLVDAVSDILNASDSEIQPPPDVGCETVRTFLRGILAIDDRMISVVSLDNLLPELPLAEAA
ncbi:MAG TPA: chemotaxis protein CheW [Hyphomonadaceae bacterium]|jgi:purine-binding chemotaxis protein CheW|nr:chemotaxis protein CheW [Hyphomonadaceae bacterium]